MRALIFTSFAASLIFGCGGVKDKEVKLEMLPEGETNASYTSSAATSEETEEEDDDGTTDTATLTPLQNIMKEIEAKRTDTNCYSTGSNTSGTPSSGCSFTTEYQVTDAIVTAAKACLNETGKKCGSVTIGQDWAYIEEIGGGGMLLNPFGWTDTALTTTLKVGDKISFKALKMKYRFGRGYIFKIDESSLVISSATTAELFKLANQVTDIGTIDFSKKSDGDYFYRLVSGYVKVSKAAVIGTTFGNGSDSANYFALNTKSYPLDPGFWFRTSSSSLVVKDKCYEVKNLAAFWSTTTSPNGYIVDLSGFDFTNTTYGMGSITLVDCTVAGL